MFELIHLFAVGGRKLHQLREGHQLALVRRLRRCLQQRQQLAVDAVHRARWGQPHLHRSQVLDARLLALPRHGALVQGNLQPPLLRVRRRHAGAASVGARLVQTHRPHRCRRGPLHLFQRGKRSIPTGSKTFFFLFIIILLLLIS